MTQEQKEKLSLIMDTSISAVSIIHPSVQSILIVIESGESYCGESYHDYNEIRRDLTAMFYNASCVYNILNQCTTDEEWEEWDDAIDEYLANWRSNEQV